MTKNFTPIGDLFAKHRSDRIIVPAFQRPYSWEKSHVENLYKDMLDYRNRSIPGSEGYFVGPIVSLSEHGFQLLDGQQRLATLTIFLSVLRDFADAMDNEDARTIARDIQRDYIEKKADVYSLELGEVDQQFFRRVIQKRNPEVLNPKLRSHQRISEAKQVLHKALSLETEGLSLERTLRILQDWSDFIASSVLVTNITVGSEETAYQIFETLNDRGLRLSVPDLLLNYLMRIATPNQRPQIRDEWTSMLEILGQRDISKFLRYMWVSRHGDPKSQTFFREIKDYLESNKKPALEFVEECSQDCDAYTGILDLNKSLLGEATSLYQIIGEHLEVQAVYPLFLSCAVSLKDRAAKKILEKTRDLIIRHSILVRGGFNELEAVLFKAAYDIRKLHEGGESDADVVKKIIAQYRSIDPSDAEIIAEGHTITLTRTRAQLIVTELANASLGNSEFIVADASIEHIYPQRAGLDKWPNKEDLSPFLWALGNLTLIGSAKNSKAGNRSFADKCKSFYAKSSVPMTKEICQNSRWTPAEVQGRSEELVHKAIEIWPPI